MSISPSCPGYKIITCLHLQHLLISPQNHRMLPVQFHSAVGQMLAACGEHLEHLTIRASHFPQKLLNIIIVIEGEFMMDLSKLIASCLSGL